MADNWVYDLMLAGPGQNALAMPFGAMLPPPGTYGQTPAQRTDGRMSGAVPGKIGPPTTHPLSADALSMGALQMAGQLSPLASYDDLAKAWPQIAGARTWGELLPPLATGALAVAGMVPGVGPEVRGAKGIIAPIRAYHGARTAIPKFKGGFWSSREPAIFFSEAFADAREFGRMKTAGDRPIVTRADLNPKNAGDYRYTRYAEGGDPLYTPETMERILAEAQKAGNDIAIIRGIQNFEHSFPTTSYAVFDPSIINVRPWPQFRR